MRHNDVSGWVAITNDDLKFRKNIEFESLCIVICFSYIYLIIMEKVHLSIKQVLKNLFRALLQPICTGELCETSTLV